MGEDNKDILSYLFPESYGKGMAASGVSSNLDYNTSISEVNSGVNTDYTNFNSSSNDIDYTKSSSNIKANDYSAPSSVSATSTFGDSGYFWGDRMSNKGLSAGDQYMDMSGNVKQKALEGGVDKMVGSGNGLAKGLGTSYGTLTDASGNVTYLDQASASAIQQSGGLNGADGLTFKATTPKVDTGITMTDVKQGTGALVDVVNAGLAIKGYNMKKKLMNKQLEALDEQLKQSRKEAKATDDYRAAYGVKTTGY